MVRPEKPIDRPVKIHKYSSLKSQKTIEKIQMEGAGWEGARGMGKGQGSLGLGICGHNE